MSFFALDDLRRRPLPVAIGVAVGTLAVWMLNRLSSGEAGGNYALWSAVLASYYFWTRLRWRSVFAVAECFL